VCSAAKLVLSAYGHKFVNSRGEAKAFAVNEHVVGAGVVLEV
jgi:hypothetical protein